MFERLDQDTQGMKSHNVLSRGVQLDPAGEHVVSANADLSSLTPEQHLFVDSVQRAAAEARMAANIQTPSLQPGAPNAPSIWDFSGTVDIQHRSGSAEG